MHFQQYDLDLMKREVAVFGVDALLTPDGRLKLIADLEAARAEMKAERDTNALLLVQVAEAREQVRIMGEAMDRGSGF